MRRICLSSILVLLLLLGSTVLYAQSEADQELIKQARLLYYAPASRPAYIACDSTLDWDAVAKEVNFPQTEGYLRGLELVKAMKITFVTRGELHTEVTVAGDSTLAQQKEMIQKQISAFFHAYWAMSDGGLLPRSNAPYKVSLTADGYLITLQLEDGTMTTVQMDNSFLIVKAHATSKTSKLELTPKFVRENDGLLHLHGISYEYEPRDSKLLIDYSFDYQEVGRFYVPQNVTMSMRGMTKYTHTFNNCRVLDKASAPAP